MKRKPMSHYHTGEVVTCLTVVEISDQIYRSKTKRGYMVQHTHKADPGQPNEPCGKITRITQEGLRNRIVTGLGQYCKKCAPRGPKSGKRPNTLEREEDTQFIAEEFKLMDQFSLQHARPSKLWCDHMGLR